MKRKIIALIALTISLTFSGCAYMNVRVPLDTDVATTQLGNKVGMASTHAVLGLVAWGDAGTAEAAKNGNITTIKHLDRQVFVVAFGAYSRITTIAYGD